MFVTSELTGVMEQDMPGLARAGQGRAAVISEVSGAGQQWPSVPSQLAWPDVT